MSKYFGPSADSVLHNRAFSPLFAALENARWRRSCTSLPDLDWLEVGVRRCWSGERTGRGFLDELADNSDRYISRSLFFESLNSQRRLALLGDVATAVGKSIDKACANDRDPFSQIASLNNYDIYCGDGHYVEHATHDLAIDSCVFATGDMFALNLRSHSLSLLTHAMRGNGRKREHDMHALKRLHVDTFRQGAPKGRQVIWVWDKAGVDAQFWVNLKMKHGIYFISRAKDNMTLHLSGILEYDVDDPNNAGVTAFELVTVAHQALRCVRYTCPVSGKKFTFITTLTAIEPGIIAQLYRARWDIEKVFDVTKQKLRESKSWGTSETAKIIHAQFRVLSYNLLLILERNLEQEHDVVDHIEITRRQKRERADVDKAESTGGQLAPLARALIRRATQRTLKFIRWVRNNIDALTPWHDLLERLRGRLGHQNE